VDAPTGAAAAAAAAEAGKVCLGRNMAAAAGGEPGEDATLAALAQVQMVNGLECKLCSAQQKVKKVRCAVPCCAAQCRRAHSTVLWWPGPCCGAMSLA
jgi:hypothetical protein